MAPETRATFQADLSLVHARSFSRLQHVNMICFGPAACSTCVRQQSQEHINYSSIIFCSLGSTVYCTSFWSIASWKLTHDQGIGCISLGWFFTWCANIMKFIGSCGWEHCVLSVDCWQAEQGDAYSCLCVESVSRQTYQFPTPQHLHMLHTLHSLQAVSYSLISAVESRFIVVCIWGYVYLLVTALALSVGFTGPPVSGEHIC